MSYLVVLSGPPVGPPEAQPRPTSEELGNFQAALGSAVAAWQLVEMMLQFTFQAVIESPHRSAVSAVYHSVVNFRARLEMIDAAMEKKHGGTDILNEWKAISGTVSKQSRRRNNLAHSIIYFEPEAKEGLRIFMAQSITVPKMLGDIKKVKTGAIYYKDMLEITQSFETTRSSLMVFSMTMPGAVFEAGPG